MVKKKTKYWTEMCNECQGKGMCKECNGKGEIKTEIKPKMKRYETTVKIDLLTNARSKREAKQNFKIDMEYLDNNRTKSGVDLYIDAGQKIGTITRLVYKW